MGAYTLTITPDPANLQGRFEKIARQFGLRPGIMSISDDGKRYLNKNVHWLWCRFQAHAYEESIKRLGAEQR